MELNNYIFVVLALGIVAGDFFIRLRLAPGRRDNSVESLLQTLLPVHETPVNRRPLESPLEMPVANSLLKHFEQSFASSHIVAALAETPREMTEKELERRFAEVISRSGKPTLPSAVIRKVVMALMSADFVMLKGGKIQMTELGRQLTVLLQARKGC